MLRHQENLYKTINIIYHGKYSPYPMLSYGPYDCPLCPVKGLYHEMRSIVIACRGVHYLDLLYFDTKEQEPRNESFIIPDTGQIAHRFVAHKCIHLIPKRRPVSSN